MDGLGRSLSHMERTAKMVDGSKVVKKPVTLDELFAVVLGGFEPTCEEEITAAREAFEVLAGRLRNLEEIDARFKERNEKVQELVRELTAERTGHSVALQDVQKALETEHDLKLALSRAEAAAESCQREAKYERDRSEELVKKLAGAEGQVQDLRREVRQEQIKSAALAATEEGRAAAITAEIQSCLKQTKNAEAALAAKAQEVEILERQIGKQAGRAGVADAKLMRFAADVTEIAAEMSDEQVARSLVQAAGSAMGPTDMARAEKLLGVERRVKRAVAVLQSFKTQETVRLGLDAALTILEGSVEYGEEDLSPGGALAREQEVDALSLKLAGVQAEIDRLLKDLTDANGVIERCVKGEPVNVSELAFGSLEVRRMVALLTSMPVPLALLEAREETKQLKEKLALAEGGYRACVEALPDDLHDQHVAMDGPALAETIRKLVDRVKAVEGRDPDANAEAIGLMRAHLAEVGITEPFADDCAALAKAEILKLRTELAGERQAHVDRQAALERVIMERGDILRQLCDIAGVPGEMLVHRIKILAADLKTQLDISGTLTGKIERLREELKACSPAPADYADLRDRAERAEAQIAAFAGEGECIQEEVDADTRPPVSAEEHDALKDQLAEALAERAVHEAQHGSLLLRHAKDTEQFARLLKDMEQARAEAYRNGKSDGDRVRAIAEELVARTAAQVTAFSDIDAAQSLRTAALLRAAQGLSDAEIVKGRIQIRTLCAARSARDGKGCVLAAEHTSDFHDDGAGCHWPDTERAAADAPQSMLSAVRDALAPVEVVERKLSDPTPLSEAERFEIAEIARADAASLAEAAAPLSVEEVKAEMLRDRAIQPEPGLGGAAREAAIAAGNPIAAHGVPGESA